MIKCILYNLVHLKELTTKGCEQIPIKLPLLMMKPLPHEVTGNKSSDKILVFMHGWPDTPALWDRIVPAFQKDHYILILNYPNYSPKETNPKGLDYEEVALRAKATIDLVNDTSRKIFVVSHDFGAAVGYYLDHLYPKYITEMVALDSAAHFNPYHPIIVFYQLVLVLAFLIGGTIGKFLTHRIMKLFGYWPEWADRVDSSWNYHYYYRWKKIFKAYGNFDKAILPGYKPSCSLTYIYGAKKPMQFFKQAWLDTLAENPKNEVIVAQTGHWIQKDQPELVVNIIKRKLALMNYN